MYPDVAPMWFSDSDDPEIIALIEKCNSVSSPSHLLLHMLNMLVLELCRIKKVKPSDDLSKLTVVPTEVSFYAFNSYVGKYGRMHCCYVVGT